MAYLDTLVSRKEVRPETGTAASSAKGTLPQHWRKHRGGIYLIVAAILLAAVVWRLDGDAAAAALGKRSRPTTESALRILLVKLGLTSSPSLPHPNDRVRVWVDLRRGVYYCAGDRRYGRTKDGQFTTQHDARLSQYEPAAHKICQ